MYRAIDESMSMSYLIIYMTELAENNVYAVNHAIYVSLCAALSHPNRVYVAAFSMMTHTFLDYVDFVHSSIILLTDIIQYHLQ